MKRKDLLRRLDDLAAVGGVEFVFVREGRDHSVYRIAGRTLPIPRHREINDRTAQGILADARKEVFG